MASRSEESLHGVLERALADARRNTVVAAIAAMPRSTSLGDLISACKSGGVEEVLLTLTINDISGASGTATTAPVRAKRGRPAGSKGKKAAPANEAAKAATKAGKRNTRTEAGRNAIDSAILEALGKLGEPARSEAIRPIVGGTTAQVRDALKRLKAAKKVSIKGSKRATTYALA